MVSPEIRRYARLVFLLALFVRLAWSTLATVTPISDFHGYDVMARGLLHTGEFAHGMGRAYRTPAYSGLLAGVYAVCGENIRAVWLVQSVLGALTAALVVLIAALLFSPRAAFLAGLIQAVWPTAVIYVPVLASENLAAPLLLLTVLAIGWGGRRGGRGGIALYLLAGVLYALLLLVRPSNLFFAPALGLLVLRDFQRRAWHPKAVLVFGVGLVAAWSPWVIRNYGLGLGFRPLSTQGGIVFWYGNNPWAVSGGAMPPRFPEEAGLNEVEFDRFYFQKAFEWIGANPRRYLQLCRVRAARFFGRTGDGFAARYWWPSAENDHAFLERDRGKDPTSAASVRANALEARHLKYEMRLRRVMAPLLLLAFVWALVRFRQYALVTLPVCCYCFGLTVTAFVERYRVVTDPLMFIPLAALLSDLVLGTRDLGAGRRSRWVKWGLAITAVAGSFFVQKTRLDEGWYVLPPMAQPPPSANRVQGDRDLAWGHVGDAYGLADFTNEHELHRPARGLLV
jgi:4-amino-4-deoxy-L-arabinose transferase-like glycosyltransferase